MSLEAEIGSLVNASTPPFELRAGPYASGELRVRAVSGREALSECFRFDVDLATHLEPADLRTLLGQPASLVIRGLFNSPRLVQGLVMSIRQGEPLRTYDRRFHLALVPTLWLLNRRTNSQIFQDMTVIEVVSAILKDAGVTFRVDAQRTYPKRAYCVQYKESDYDFLIRLLREAGLFYYFEPPPYQRDSLVGGPTGGNGSSGDSSSDATVVLCDVPDNYPAISASHSGATSVVGAITGALGGDSSSNGGSPSLLFRPETGIHHEDDYRVSKFEFERVLTSKSVTVRDYDFRHPLMTLEAGASTPTSDAAPDDPAAAVLDPATMEVYEHHGEDENPDVRRQTARTMLEGFRAAALVGEGASPNSQIAPGYRFTLDDHPDGGLNQQYVVVSVEHEGVHEAALNDGNVRSAASDRPTYRNRFRCLPSTVPARPHPVERNLQQVVEVATVVGPAGEEIHTDTFGRIKVQFPWDREGKRNERSSCWMRVTQAWSGAMWGAQFIPRIGMEVLVTFLGGDVDRPVVTGCLYNAIHPTPFELPKDKTRSGWRTQSTAGDMPDAAGGLLGAAEAVVGAVAGALMGGGDPLSAGGAAAAGAADALGGAAGGAIGGALSGAMGSAGGAGGALASAASSAGAGIGSAVGDAIGGSVGGAIGAAVGAAIAGIAGAAAAGPAGGYNELSFEDSSGREQIFLHAQRDLDEIVLRNHTSTVHVDEKNVVTHNQSDSVHGNRQRTTNGNEKVHVGKDQSVKVGGNRTEEVDGNEREQIKKDYDFRVGGRERREITGMSETAYQADAIVRARGSVTTLVGKPTKPREFVVHAIGAARVSGTTEVEITSAKSIVLRCGKSSLTMTPDGIEISAAAVNIVGKGAGLSAADKLTLTTNDLAALIAKKIVLKSDQASISLDKDAKIDGGNVMFKSPASADDASAVSPPPTTVELADTNGKPIPNQRFTITLDDGSIRSGHTDKDGKAEMALDQGGTIVFPDLTDPKKG